MDCQGFYFTLLTAFIFSMANTAYSFENNNAFTKDKVTRTVAKDKGSSNKGDYRLNSGYPAAYSINDHRNGNDYTLGNYKGQSITGKYDNLEHKSSGEMHPHRHGDHRGYYGSDRKHENDKDGSAKTSNYKHNYNHGYHHSHGYHRHHHHSNGKDRDRDGDGYSVHHRFGIEHEDGHEGRNGNDRECSYGDCKHTEDRHDDEFEFHYGNNGNDRGEHNYNEGGDHGGYNHDYKHNHDYNDGVDDSGTGYHYEHTQSDDNYRKDYPATADYRYYDHGEEQDDDVHADRLIYYDH